MLQFCFNLLTKAYIVVKIRSAILNTIKKTTFVFPSANEAVQEILSWLPAAPRVLTVLLITLPNSIFSSRRWKEFPSIYFCIYLDLSMPCGHSRAVEIVTVMTKPELNLSNVSIMQILSRSDRFYLTNNISQVICIEMSSVRSYPIAIIYDVIVMFSGINIYSICLLQSWLTGIGMWVNCNQNDRQYFE